MFVVSHFKQVQVQSVLTRLAQHAARWAEQGRVTEGGGREGGGGELGFQLPAFTPSLMLKIAPITGAFWGGLFSGQSRAVWSDVITQINPVTQTHTLAMSQSLNSPRSTQTQLPFTWPQQEVAGLCQGEKEPL